MAAMFDRFREDARKALNLAKRRADLEGGYLEPRHLLPSIFEASGSAAALLQRLGVFPAALCKSPEPEASLAPRQASVLPFSDALKAVLESSVKAADDWKHDCIGTEHLLFALAANAQGAMRRAFDDSGLSTAKLDEAISAFLSETTPVKSSPTCSFCSKPRNEVRALIAGPPGIYVCDDCIMICESILADRGDEPEPGHATDQRQCTFCELPGHRVKQLISGPPGMLICNECTGTCSAILAEEDGKREVAQPRNPEPLPATAAAPTGAPLAGPAREHDDSSPSENEGHPLNPGLLLEAAFSSIADQARRNGVATSKIQREGGAVTTRNGHWHVECSVDVERTRAVGRLRKLEAEVHQGQQQAQSAAEAYAASLLASTSVIEGVVAELISRPDHGTRLQDCPKLDGLSKTFACSIPCGRCGQAGSLRCSECGGCGSIRCNCTGGQQPCGYCGGSGKQADSNCFGCHGSGYDTCTNCGGRQYLTCNSCVGSGSLRCGRCAGQGAQLETHEVQAKTILVGRAEWGDVPHDAKRALDKIGASRFLGELGRAIGVEQRIESPRNAILRVGMEYTYGRLGVRVAGKPFAFHVIGPGPLVVPEGAFLEDLAKEGIRDLNDASSASLRRTIELLERACRFDLIREAVACSFMLWKGSDKLREKYPSLDEREARLLVYSANTACTRISRAYRRRARAVFLLLAAPMLFVGLALGSPRNLGWSDLLLLVGLSLFGAHVLHAGTVRAGRLIDRMLEKPLRAKLGIARIWLTCKFLVRPRHWYAPFLHLVVLSAVLLEVGAGLDLIGNATWARLRDPWAEVTAGFWAGVREGLGPSLDMARAGLGGLDAHVQHGWGWFLERVVIPAREWLSHTIGDFVNT